MEGDYLGHLRWWPAPLPVGTYAVFANPMNGYQETVPGLSHLWMFLFGVFYLIARGLCPHVAAVLLAAATTMVVPILGVLALFILWIVYAIRAPHMIIANYRRRGWQQVA